MNVEILAVIISGIISILASIFLHVLNRRANKKDSVKINGTIESIKSQFQKINDQFKAEIELSYQTKKELAQDQKKAILEFWEEHFSMLRLCDPTRYEIDELRLQEYIEFRKTIEKQQDVCDISFIRLYFFLGSPELTNLADKINQDCQICSIKFISFLDRIERPLRNAKNCLANGDNLGYKQNQSYLESEGEKFNKYLKEINIDDPLETFKRESWLFLFGKTPY